LKSTDYKPAEQGQYRPVGPVKWAKAKLMVCLISHFTQKILGFGLSYCRMELNTVQIFGKKVSILHFGFWHQETKKSQKAKKPSSTP
jgi:hypothetical protein